MNRSAWRAFLSGAVAVFAAAMLPSEVQADPGRGVANFGEMVAAAWMYQAPEVLAQEKDRKWRDLLQEKYGHSGVAVTVSKSSSPDMGGLKFYEGSVPGVGGDSRQEELITLAMVSMLGDSRQESWPGEDHEWGSGLAALAKAVQRWESVTRFGWEE